MESKYAPRNLRKNEVWDEEAACVRVVVKVSHGVAPRPKVRGKGKMRALGEEWLNVPEPPPMEVPVVRLSEEIDKMKNKAREYM